MNYNNRNKNDYDYDRDNYIDSYYSEVAKTIRERSKPNIALFSSSRNGRRPGPSCPLCHIFYIPLENGTILFCTRCGRKLKEVDIKRDINKVTALYRPLSRSPNGLIYSQTQKQARGKKKNLQGEYIDDLDEAGANEELRKELGLGFESSVSISVVY